MDFNGLKDQLANKAKDELLQKVDGIKQDITEKFADGNPAKTSTEDSGPAPASGTQVEQPKAETEGATAEAEDTEIEGKDVQPSEDNDKKEEAA